jgi:hypothetical protein
MSQLLNRARSLIQSNSPLVAALAILPVSTMAQADTVSLSDLQVNYSGAYFYNSSGYFAEYDSGPSDSQVFNETNPDGSPKLYGSLSVSAAELYAHNMHYDDEGNPAYFSRDAGAVMVWGGTVQRVPGVGDSLSIHYDFSVGFDAPATGVSYFLSAYLGSYEPSNHVYNSLLNNWTEINGENLLGNVTTQPLQDYEIGSENYYWQIVVGVYGSAYDWGQTDNGIYTTHFPGVSLTVPNQSIDVSYVAAVPLPGAAVLFLGGLLPLLSIAGRRNA